MNRFIFDHQEDCIALPGTAFVGLSQIPALSWLKQNASWVGYRLVERQQATVQGRDGLPPKVTKPPFNPKTGHLASVTDPSTWASYEEAAKWATNTHAPGVGIILQKTLGVVAIDLDDCLDEKGEPNELARQVLDLGETYTEISPSGRGLRLIAYGQLDSAIVCHAAGIEVYDEKRFVTITGNQWLGSCDAIGPAPKVLALLKERTAFAQTSVRTAAKSVARERVEHLPRGTDFFRNVNELGLRNLSLWVPDLLPEARCISDEQGYRVSSVDLGRDLDEDLCIHPSGIMDFGVHDMGDAKAGSRTAIDLVIEHGVHLGLDHPKGKTLDELFDHAVLAQRAADWLCTRMEVSPFDLGKEPRSEAEWLQWMNGRYAVTTEGGKAFVLHFDEEEWSGKPRKKLTHSSFAAIRDFYCNRYVMVPTGSEGELAPKAVGQWWLTHPARRQYGKIVFQPGKPAEIGGNLNLWRGFGIEPKAGNCSLLMRHIREVLADDDPEVAEYILKWCAFAVQHPDRQAGTALVFQGNKGTGKSTLCNLMVNIFGQHGITVSTADQLVGKFNAHLRDAVLVLAEEAYWPGDRSLTGNLKRLITEPNLFIEAKGQNGVTTPNFLHIMMSSNEDWIVPASENERRYAVFKVSDRYMQNPAWFEPLYEEMQNGGAEAFVYELLNMDLSGWNNRKIPQTQALADQQDANMDIKDSWWQEALESGLLPGAHWDSPNVASTADLVSSIHEFGGPSARYLNPRSMATFCKSVGCNSARLTGGRGWQFPPLKHARKQFKSRYPGVTWDETITDWGVLQPFHVNKTFDLQNQ